MSRTVLGLFDGLGEAQRAVEELVAVGFKRDAISLLARDAEGEAAVDPSSPDVVNDAVAAGAGSGATAGTAIGGALGLLVGLGALAIPGFGPVIAAGSLATALGTAALGAGVGAAAGGLAGGLTSVGVHPSDVTYYTEGIREGGVLVAVTAADDEQTHSAQAILQRHGGSDVKNRIIASSQAAEQIDNVSLTLPAGAAPVQDAFVRAPSAAETPDPEQRRNANG